MPDATRSNIDLIRYGFDDVCRRTLNLLRHPVSFILFLWLTSLSFQIALKPLNGVLAISTNHHNTTIHPVFPRPMNLNTTFKQLLDKSARSSRLSWEIRKVEMAVVDLIIYVEYSQLSNRQNLVNSLTLFAKDARLTADGLQSFVSKVKGEVIMINAVNRCAVSSSSPSSSLFSPAIISSYFCPFTDGEALLKTMTFLGTQVESLIRLAEVQIMNIGRLEEHLSVIHDLTVQEDSAIWLAKAGLLGDIWTLLGGILNGYDRNLELLRTLGGLQLPAWDHVTSALHILKKLRDDIGIMEEMLSR